MAVRYAVATGNWSNTATWDGGTLPTVGDDVHANGFTVTIDQNITVNKISTETNPITSLSGGRFIVNATRTLVCNVVAGTTLCLFQSTSNTTLTLIGNISGGTAINAYGLSINCQTNGSLTSLNMTGDIIAGPASGCHGVFQLWTGGVAQNMSINLTGNVYSSATSNGIAASTTTAHQMTVFTLVGNLYSSVVPAVGGFTNNATIIGSINASSTAATIGPLNSNSTLIISGFITQTSDLLAHTFNRVKISQGGTLVTNYIEDITNASIILRTPITGGNYPVVTNVRSAVVYGSVNEFTGTLSVPPASSVAVGVPVDDTVGTAMISITDMGALLASYII
jgi:hypothetical protein